MTKKNSGVVFNRSPPPPLFRGDDAMFMYLDFMKIYMNKKNSGFVLHISPPPPIVQGGLMP